MSQIIDKGLSWLETIRNNQVEKHFFSQEKKIGMQYSLQQFNMNKTNNKEGEGDFFDTFDTLYSRNICTGILKNVFLHRLSF